jgi:UDP-glucose 4-epimerase
MMKMPEKDQSIVVLGAAGFIGFHLASALSRIPGVKLRLADNFVRGQKDSDLRQLLVLPNIEFINCDLTLNASYQGLFDEGDEVFNCVALNGTQNFYDRPLDVIENSSIPSILAAKHAAIAKVRRYYYFGSSESYAGGLELGLVALPTPEDVPHVFPDLTQIRWSYGISKSVGEYATEASRNQHHLESCILRIHNIYGPRMGDKHVIPDLADKFSRGCGEVYGLDETRCFLYIDDLISAILQLRLIEKLPHVINVGSSEEISVQSLAKLLLSLLDISLDLVDVGHFPGSVKRRVPDVSLLHSLVDIRETPLEVGLKLYLAKEGFLK